MLATSYPTTSDSRSVLFIGNSYTMSNNLPHMVKAFLAERGIYPILRKSVAGGATLKEHWMEQRELQSRKLIQSSLFSLVILQANSRAALDCHDETIDFGGRLIQEIRNHGGFPMLYQTWARMDSIGDQKQINAMYRKLSEMHHVHVVPVGSAWKLMRETWSDANAPLFTNDGHHPSIMGTYLAACVMFEALSGQSCIGLTNEPIIRDGDDEFIILMSLESSHATQCQRIAHQAIKEVHSDYHV